MAAAFAVKKAFDPLDFVERWAGTVLCALVLLLGILLLCFIQYDIGGHRERIGLDATAYTRGLEFTIPLGPEHILCLLHCGLCTLAGLPMLGTIARTGLIYHPASNLHPLLERGNLRHVRRAVSFRMAAAMSAMPASINGSDSSVPIVSPPHKKPSCGSGSRKCSPIERATA